MADFLLENNVYQPTAAASNILIADPVYEARGIFSINAANQLQGTLWVVKNGQVMTTLIGDASYQIFDKDGTSIAISESGIAADVNGQYIITPVIATLITDLTHYVVKVTIEADTEDRINYLGITLGE